MESVKLILREKHGRKTVYREVQVPSDETIDRVASELHAGHAPALRNILGWRVFYMPSFPIRYTTRDVDPFTGAALSELRAHESPSVASCTFGYGQAWSVTLSWTNGDNQPPVRTNQSGDVAYGRPLVDQEPLFGRTHAVDKEDLLEGARSRVEADAYERNPEARRLCLDHYGTQCVVCGFDFGETFGKFAVGFIHVHHLRPIATIGREYAVDPVKDLRPVCPNCHSALHLQDPPMTPDELRAIRESLPNPLKRMVGRGRPPTA